MARDGRVPNRQLDLGMEGPDDDVTRYRHGSLTPG